MNPTNTSPDNTVTVLHVLWRLSTDGGVQRVVRDALAHADSSITFHVMTVRPLAVQDRLDEFPDTEFHFGGLAGRLSALDRVRAFVRTRRTIRRVRPDVVQVHTGTAWLGFAAVGLVPGRRVVCEVHDAPGNGRHSKATERIEGLLARRLHWRLVAHSTSSANETATAWRIERSTIEQFPLGVTIPSGPPERHERLERDVFTSDPDAVLAMGVGRLVSSKNFALTLEAVALARRQGSNVHLAVVGDGSLRDELRRRTAELGLDPFIRFVGSIAPADPAIRAADLVVSTSDYEGFGLVPAEAAANGIPVIATSVGGCTDVVVHDVTGLLVPKGDLAATAAALVALASDVELRVRLGRAAAERAAVELSVEATAARWSALYHSVAATPH